jgi:hypothetical protein
MAAYHEVRTEHLYVKVPGSDRLRKTAAGWLRHLLATGWEETGRRVRSDHVEVRLERTTSGPLVTRRRSPAA